ncbi:MAG: hypothetical protein QXI49_00805 [Candidatus Methanomethylicaceae archaeon]
MCVCCYWWYWPKCCPSHLCPPVCTFDPHEELRILEHFKATLELDLESLNKRIEKLKKSLQEEK